MKTKYLKLKELLLTAEYSIILNRFARSFVNSSI